MLELEIYKDNVDPALWDELISHANPDIHNIYQTYEWANLMKDCYGQIPFFLIFKSDKNICGGQLCFKKSVLKIFSAFEAHGGPLCIGKDWIQSIDESIINYLQNGNYHYLYSLIRPNINLPSNAYYINKGFSKSPFFTFILNISKDQNDLWSSFHKNARNGIRKAEKCGINILEAEDWIHWLTFYELHARHSQSRRIAAKKESFFKRLYDEFIPKNMAKLFLAYKNESLIAGMLFLNFHGVMTYYIGASSNDDFNCSSNDLLMWNAIKWGKLNCFNKLDLGDTWPNPKSHLYSIHKFKAKWGGDLIESNFFINGQLYKVGRDLVLNNRSIQNFYELLHKHNLM